MCIVKHVEKKSVFTLQPIRRLVSRTVRSAKPAGKFWTFLLRTRNRQLFCLAVTVHILLLEKRVATTKKKNHFRFWRNFSAKNNQAHPNLNQKSRSYSIYGMIVSTPHWLIQSTKNSFPFSFHTRLVYSKATCFCQTPTTDWKVSRLWTWFSYSDCK